MKRYSRAWVYLIPLMVVLQSADFLAAEEVLSQPLLEWQAAYIIEDIPRHLELAQRLFEKEASGLHASLLMRSYSQNLQIDEALKIFEGPFKQQILTNYPDALKDLAWATLSFYMRGASTEQISWILQSLYLVRDIEMAPLVIEALSHSDLRINMQALSLVESYPLDVYRPLVLDLWKTRSNTLIKARILGLAAHLKWPEAEEMAVKLKQEGENPGRELVITLADYEMLKSRLDLDALLIMAQGQPLIPVRMAAWCLRYQTSDLENLPKVYNAIFEKKDSLSTLLALDTLLHFHLTRIKELEVQLKTVQANWPASLIDRQISWILAVASGAEARLDWVQKKTTEAASQDSLGQTGIAWALASRFEDTKLVSYLWNQRRKMAAPSQLQTAWAIVQTSHKHDAQQVQEAIQYVSNWLIQGPDYWSQDSDWPGLIQLRENPPIWMPVTWVREAAIELRLAILGDLSLRFPDQAYQLASQLYAKEPEAYLASLMSLAWSQGRLLPVNPKDKAKEVLLIRALMGADPKDKTALAATFSTSDERSKEQIMEAMLQLADESDLEFFTAALREPTRLSIKSASGILIALRQGTRSNPSQ